MSKIEVEKIPQNVENAENLKAAPFDDPIFMETIIKKPKNTPYVEDLLYIRPILIKFKDFLSENPENIDIQKYHLTFQSYHCLHESLLKLHF